MFNIEIHLSFKVHTKRGKTFFKPKLASCVIYFGMGVRVLNGNSQLGQGTARRKMSEFVEPDESS